MIKRSWYIIFISLGLVLLMLFLLREKIGIGNKSESSLDLQLLELRGVAKLVIWEQDFQLTHTQKEEKDYAIFKTSEKVVSNIKGKMGFHIDLADSIHAKFSVINDTIIITAPLENTYIELDLATLQQIKEKSLDPTIEIKKEEVVKKLRQRTIEEFIPNLKDRLSEKDLQYQERKLSEMMKRPVRLVISSYPNATDMNWIKLD